MDQLVSAKDFHPAVHKILHESREMLSIACSGGADSVALTYLLYGEKMLRPRLILLHFNHRLRGEAADRDMASVEDLGTKLGLPVECGWRISNDFLSTGDELAQIPQNEALSEEKLRNMRLAFFREKMAKWQTPYLLTAHHRDDGIETLLMRLARGSGLEGITAPRAIQYFRDGNCHLRPLLHIPKSFLINYLNSKNISWREDQSNQELHYMRNRIRRQLLPLWESLDFRRNLADSLHYSQELFREENDALQQLTTAFLKKYTGENSPPEICHFHGKNAPARRLKSIAHLPATAIFAQPSALQRRILQQFLTARGHFLERKSMELLLKSLREKKKAVICLDKTARIRCDGDWIILERNTIDDGSAVDFAKTMH